MCIRDSGVPGAGGFLQELELVAHGVGENRLKSEALPLLDERASQGVGDLRGGIRIHVQFVGESVGFNVSQASALDMGVIERGLARAVRARDSDDDRPLVQLGEFLQWAGVNWRLMNRPSVRLPSASIRTKIPGLFSTGS